MKHNIGLLCLLSFGFSLPLFGMEVNNKKLEEKKKAVHFKMNSTLKRRHKRAKIRRKEETKKISDTQQVNESGSKKRKRKENKPKKLPLQRVKKQKVQRIKRQKAAIIRNITNQPNDGKEALFKLSVKRKQQDKIHVSDSDSESSFTVSGPNVSVGEEDWLEELDKRREESEKKEKK